MDKKQLEVRPPEDQVTLPERSATPQLCMLTALYTGSPHQPGRAGVTETLLSVLQGRCLQM